MSSQHFVLDISRFVGIAAIVNANNLAPQSWKKVDSETGRASPPSVEPAAAYVERDLGLTFVPSGQNGEPPQFQSISAIDFLVKTLTPEPEEADASEPSVSDWKDSFLRALAKAPIVTVAARIAGVSRARAIEERRSDHDFARRWTDAVEEGVDEVEAAAFRGAVYGDEKPVFYRGHPVGWTVNYSHVMRSMLLKTLRPAVFGKQGKPEEKKAVGMTLAELRERVAEARRMGD